MADTHETIADIIAEMRRNFADGNPYYAAGLPDRLEAAHRRELARVDAVIDEAVHGYPPEDIYDKRERGNAAKLREALEHLLHGEYRDRCEVTNIAHSALSAPPRNCDLAQDWIRDIYAHFQPPASVKREMPPEWVDAVMAFCRWLVAPATEGGDK